MNLMRPVAFEFDHSQNEVIGHVKRIKYFVLGYRQYVFARRSSFYFDEAKRPLVRVFAFYIVTKFLQFAIRRFKSETTFNLHDNGAGARRYCLTINSASWFSLTATCHSMKKPNWQNDEPAQNYRRRSGDLPFQVELLH